MDKPKSRRIHSIERQGSALVISYDCGVVEVLSFPTVQDAQIAQMNKVSEALMLAQEELERYKEWLLSFLVYDNCVSN